MRVDSLAREQPDCQEYHFFLSGEQHRRLRLVCSTLGIRMSDFIRPLVCREVDKQFVKLGLDRIRPVNGRAK